MTDDDTLSLSSSSDESDQQQQQFSRTPKKSPSSMPVPRTRTALLANQKTKLMALWDETHFPSSSQRHELSVAINLPPRKVQVWFQNMRQKVRRAERDHVSAARTQDASFGLSSQQSGSPSQRRPSTASRPQSAALPSISSFMLSHAPTPSVFGNASAPPSSSSMGQAPRPRSPRSLPSVFQFSRIGPPAQIHIEIDPRVGMASSHSPTLVSRPPARSQSFAPPDRQSSGMMSHGVAFSKPARRPSPEPAPAPHARPDARPDATLSFQQPINMRLPSISDLLNPSEPRALESLAPSPDYSAQRSGYAWSTTSPQAGGELPGRGPFPPKYCQPIGKHFAPTFASPPLPRSTSPLSQPVPSMSPLVSTAEPAYHAPPPGLSRRPASYDTFAGLDVDVGSWPYPGKSSVRSASMSDVEAPRYGSRHQPHRPPGHLEVVGTGGKAGLGRWSIANCGGRC